MTLYTNLFSGCYIFLKNVHSCPPLLGRKTLSTNRPLITREDFKLSLQNINFDRFKWSNVNSSDGVAVSMDAFQAFDPGSIPGSCKIFITSLINFCYATCVSQSTDIQKLSLKNFAFII